jgi:hypothetical protein
MHLKFSVAANNDFRDEVRGVSATFDFHNVEYRELEYQPRECQNLWTFKKKQREFKGVIQTTER